MSFQQTVPFNTSKGGTTPNMCLDNVRRGYGIANKYGSAWEAWQHTEQHADRNIPAGLDVPLYYSYTATIDGVSANYGHINVRLANGTVWSDGKIYANLDAYLANHWPKYVGWGESVNDAQIIKGVNDMEKVDLNTARILAAFIGGRNGRGGRPNALAGDTDADLNANHVGRDLSADIYLWFQSDESKAFNKAEDAAYAQGGSSPTKQTVIDYINQHLS